MAQRFNAAIKPFVSVRALAPEVPRQSFATNCYPLDAQVRLALRAAMGDLKESGEGYVENQKVRHRGLTAHVRARYRCFLPDLAGLAGVRRVGPMPDLNYSSIQRLRHQESRPQYANPLRRRALAQSLHRPQLMSLEQPPGNQEQEQWGRSIRSSANAIHAM